MADYHEWKGLERRFRQLHKDRLELYAEGENGSWVVRGGVEGADGEERFGELAEHAAWVDSHRDEDGKNFFLNLLNEYLLRRNSKSIEISFVVVSAAPSTRKQGSKPAKQGFPEVSTALYGKQERLLDQPVKHVVDPETGDILGTILANQPELEAALIAEAKRRRAAHSGAHQRAASRPEAAVEIRTNRTGGLSYLRNDALAVAPPVLKNQAALPLAKTWNIYKIRSVGRLSADYCLGRALEAKRRGKDSVAPQPQPGGAGKKPRQRNEKGVATLERVVSGHRINELAPFVRPSTGT